ncbi:MAG TPA: hypothetical protein DCE00_02685 [Firmicutes bacterium]|nr:hypothetical protein [Bacillota bacterium]HAA37760.1 hypothetical protein [Bacillota bacterium]
MRIKEIAEILEATIEVQGDSLDLEVEAAFGSDLMSDVMAYVKDSVLLLTGLVSPQVIRTAEMMDIKAVVLVRGKKPDRCMVQLAEEKGITLLSTKDTMFVSCGKLYSMGLTGKGVRE